MISSAHPPYRIYFPHQYHFCAKQFVAACVINVILTLQKRNR